MDENERKKGMNQGIWLAVQELAHDGRWTQAAEVSGFVTSWLSFGNRKAIIGAAERMDREFGGSPYGWLMDRQYVKVYNYQNIIR